MKGERWIEYLDDKKIVFLTVPLSKITQKGYKSYIITVPIEWIRKFPETPRIRITVEVIE